MKKPTPADIPKELDQIVDKVLAFRPPIKPPAKKQTDQPITTKRAAD